MPGGGISSSGYDWAFVRLDDGHPGDGGHGQRWLLVRRNRTTGELAYYRCWMPRPVPLATLVSRGGPALEH
jgi:hypothetical protein